MKNEERRVKNEEPATVRSSLFVLHSSSRSVLAGILLLASAAAIGCNGGHFQILGYTTEPNYDADIRTVYVPIFQNVTFDRQLEFDLTRAVIREIEAKTPFKVVSSCEKADTELIGKIVNTRKNIVLFNQIGEVREAEALMGVELVWRDLRPGRTGEILSAEGKPLPGLGGDASTVVVAPPPLPALITPQATFVPELGGSITTARKQLVDRTAIQIVSLMEKAW